MNDPSNNETLDSLLPLQPDSRRDRQQPESRPRHRRGWRRFSKRALDCAIAGLMLVFAAPVMLLIALLIKLDSEGPVFYSQIRTGLNRRHSRRRYDPSIPEYYGYTASNQPRLYNRRKNTYFGKPFKIYKFRSMVVESEKKGPVWCRANDPRVTRLGNFLRKTHLDELPQILNVLRGEMSIVGPRPERPEFIHKIREIVPDYEKRLVMKPGLTGLAQVFHRADLTMEDVKKKIRYDLLYLKNISLWTDLQLILGTVPVMAGLDPKTNRKLTARISRIIAGLRRSSRAKRKAARDSSLLN